MKSESLIVFDMDGVLIDVSGSYRETVRQTARLFFKDAAGFEQLPDPLFSLQDLAAVKQSGGLNNDWDLTHAILTLLFTRVPCPPLHEASDPWTRYARSAAQCDVSALARFLDSTERPMAALMETSGGTRNPLVDSAYTGDVGSDNIIKQIFQEIYLGEHLFADTYGLPPRAYRGEGFINREALLVRPSVLASLARDHTLAIATGRPRAEADQPLGHFHIGTYFSSVYTLDDCLRQEAEIRDKQGKTVSLSKPNPFMLDAIIDTHGGPVAKCYYVGDMPDDMVAAKNAAAPYVGVGILVSSPDRDHLKADLVRAGADVIVNDFEELVDVINQPLSAETEDSGFKGSRGRGVEG